MADPVEVAIESALLNRLVALNLSPALPVQLPNVKFTIPTVGPNVGWLRGTFLPADSVEIAIAYDGMNQHYGIFQVDVFYGLGGGELAPGRIASAIMGWFPRGTKLTKDGFTVEIKRLPFRGRLISDDPWIMIPVSITYLAYA